MKIVHLSLRCVVPDDITPEEVVEYVEESVRTMGGGGYPEDWCYDNFRLDENLKVKITYPKEKI